MAFVQIIEYRTSRFDAVEKLIGEWRDSPPEDATVRRVVVARDRDDPDHCFTLAFFDSYESAMRNSELSATQEYAANMVSLADGPPTFHDLDVAFDHTL